MYNIVSQDNGKGSVTDPNNNREFGGYVDKDGKVQSVEPGPVCTVDDNPTIKLPNGYTTFHSHPSAYSAKFVNVGHNTIGISQKTEYKFYDQWPSKSDIDAAGSSTNYVFGMRDKTVYVYNNECILTMIPIKLFIK